MNIIDFLSMNGHAAYVWSSYGLYVAALLLVFILASRRSATIRAKLIRETTRAKKYNSPDTSDS